MKAQTEFNFGPPLPPGVTDLEMSRPYSTSRSGWEGTLNIEDNPRVASVASSELTWDVENPVIKCTNNVPTNICHILTGKWACRPDPPDFSPDREVAQHRCSRKAFEAIDGDIEKAENSILRKLEVPRQRLVPLVREMAKLYPKSSISISGFFLYPDGGCMGWHTNSDSPCTRVYITHVRDGGKSYFRYRMGGEYVTSWDKAGWNLRQFEVSKERPLWHCVYSEEPRLSIGFRINRNLL